VIFLGDFIDRGPQIRQVLETARTMVEAGHALAVMGNHELNALAYHTDDPESPSEHLRPHCPKNDKQHRATLEQLKPDEFRKLRLPTIRDRFGAAAERGETENLSHLDYLSELTTLECETRRPSVLRRSTFLSLRGDSRETQPRLRKR